MNLVINGLRLMGQRLGVGRYVESLLRHWKTLSHPFDRILLYTPGPVGESLDLPPKAEHLIVPTRYSDGLWEQWVLPRLLGDRDLLFCPSYVAPFFGGGKTVLTHLGSYEALPGAFPLYQRWKSRVLYELSARRADLVITVSESSKKDIVRFYGIKPQKIRVVYLGVDPAFRPMRDEALISSTRQRYFGSDCPYILFVGKLSRRRNIPQLIAAFGRLKRERNIPHSLLLIGPDSADQDVPALAKVHNVEAFVRHVEFASQPELIAAYNAADLFIYPSTYEGFGMPVLEAMACGVPAIALRNSSFLEFAQDAAYLASDGSEEELFGAMERVLDSPELRSRMRSAGILKAQQFGWASIARQTMELLSEVATQ